MYLINSFVVHIFHLEVHSCMRIEEWELLMWTRMTECYGVVSTDQRPDLHCSACTVLNGLQISTEPPDRHPRQAI